MVVHTWFTSNRLINMLINKRFHVISSIHTKIATFPILFRACLVNSCIVLNGCLSFNSWVPMRSLQNDSRSSPVVSLLPWVDLLRLVVLTSHHFAYFVAAGFALLLLLITRLVAGLELFLEFMLWVGLSCELFIQLFVLVNVRWYLFVSWLGISR